ncbi:MAG: hypothetical protein SO147_02700, partial [Clostridia bacterium]|nr:hypothetical protein [Clostridia bacterium]
MKKRISLVLALTMVIQLLFAVPMQSLAADVSLNFGFEEESLDSAWGSYGYPFNASTQLGTQVSLSGDQARTGNGSLKAETNRVDAYGMYGAQYQMMNPDLSASYTVSGYMKVPQEWDGKKARVYVYYRTSSGSSLGNPVNSGEFVLSSDDWTELSYTIAADQIPENTGRIDIIFAFPKKEVETASAENPAVFYLDDVTIAGEFTASPDSLNFGFEEESLDSAWGIYGYPFNATTQSGTQVFLSSDQARTGNGSLKAETNRVDGYGMYGAQYQMMNPDLSASYTVSGYMKVPQEWDEKKGRIYIYYRNTSGGSIGTVNSGEFVLSSDDWTELSYTISADQIPENTGRIDIVFAFPKKEVETASAENPAVFYLDDVTIAGEFTASPDSLDFGFEEESLDSAWGSYGYSFNASTQLGTQVSLSGDQARTGNGSLKAETNRVDGYGMYGAQYQMM